MKITLVKWLYHMHILNIFLDLGMLGVPPFKQAFEGLSMCLLFTNHHIMMVAWYGNHNSVQNIYFGCVVGFPRLGRITTGFCVYGEATNRSFSKSRQKDL